MIELQSVSLRRGKNQVLSNVTLQVQPGELVCITGPSGSGKSSLLELLTALNTKYSGKLLLDGVDVRIIPPAALQMYRKKLGVVFQERKLLSGKSVSQNIAFPLEVCGASDEEIQHRITAVLNRLNLREQAHRKPQSLSSGQCSAAALARAVAHDPIILLADEPTANADTQQSEQIIQLLKDVHASGATVIIATSDAELICALSPRVVTLEHGSVVADSVSTKQTPEPAASAKPKTSDKRKVKVTLIK